MTSSLAFAYPKTIEVAKLVIAEKLHRRVSSAETIYWGVTSLGISYHVWGLIPLFYCVILRLYHLLSNYY